MPLIQDNPSILVHDRNGFFVGRYTTLESAVNAVNTNGGRITLPGGIFAETSTDVSVTTTNVTIEGAGEDTILVVNPASNSFLNAYADGFKLRNLKIRIDQWKDNQTVVHVNSVSRALIENIFVDVTTSLGNSNTPTTIFKFTGCYAPILRNSIIHPNKGVVCVSVSASSLFSILDNRFQTDDDTIDNDLTASAQILYIPRSCSKVIEITGSSIGEVRGNRIRGLGNTTFAGAAQDDLLDECIYVRADRPGTLTSTSPLYGHVVVDNNSIECVATRHFIKSLGVRGMKVSNNCFASSLGAIRKIDTFGAVGVTGRTDSVIYFEQQNEWYTITGASFTDSTRVVNATSQFKNYTWFTGDVFVALTGTPSAGSLVLTAVPIASKTDDNNIVLGADITTANGNVSGLTGYVIPISELTSYVTGHCIISDNIFDQSATIEDATYSGAHIYLNRCAKTVVSSNHFGHGNCRWPVVVNMDTTTVKHSIIGNNFDGALGSSRWPVYVSNFFTTDNDKQSLFIGGNSIVDFDNGAEPVRGVRGKYYWNGLEGFDAALKITGTNISFNSAASSGSGAPRITKAATVIANAQTIDFTSSGDSVTGRATLVRPSGSFTSTANVAANDFVKITGATGNNKVVQIASINSTTIELLEGFDVATAAGVASVTITSMPFRKLKIGDFINIAPTSGIVLNAANYGVRKITAIAANGTTLDTETTYADSIAAPDFVTQTDGTGSDPGDVTIQVYPRMNNNTLTSVPLNTNRLDKDV